MAELSALSSRNFMPDSADLASRLKAARAAMGRAVSSSATYMVISSTAEASSIIPAVEKSTSE